MKLALDHLPLHTRLTLRLAALLVTLAIILAISITHIAERYRAETTQRLNEGIAMYVTNELALINSKGVNERALKELAHRAMTVNPSAEVYLLSNSGDLLATVIPQNRIVRRHVGMEPIKAFLSGDRVRPLYGDDPTSANRQGVFSVSPVLIDGKLSGYLYVILASNRFASIAAAVRNNYTLQVALVVASGILVLTLAVGAALFRQLTLPLRRLSAEIVAWSRKAGIDSDRAPARNEIAALTDQFSRIARRVTDQADEIAARDAQRRELVANVSHDLRTPLASLNGYLETVLRKDASLSAEQRREYLQIAHRHSQQLDRLIATLFELSKLEAGETQPHIEPFNIAELLNDVAQRFRLRAERQGVALRVDSNCNAATALGDIALVERALENLIDNALQHTPDKGSITLSSRTHNNHVQVSVVDTGNGIGAEDLPHVFDRAYRGKCTNSNGAGLGLAIVKRIVELHNEQVAMHSGVGQGTCVEFGLPAVAA